MKKIQKYIGFAAAVLNILASGFYWHAQGRQYVDQVAADTSSALGNWFFVVSLFLWVIFAIIVLTGKTNKK